MDKLFADLKEKYILVYLDDITIYFPTLEQHLEHISEVFSRLKQAGLKLRKDKYYFKKQKLAFLEYIIGENRITPDPAKVEKVKNFSIPRNLTELRRFIGLASYYQQFIPNFAYIIEP